VTTPSKLSRTDVTTDDMVNRDYTPTETEEDVLEVLEEEWRVNPYLIRERTGHGKGAVNTALTRLTSAGWLKKVTRGLYEFVEDPRDSVAPEAVEEQPKPVDDVDPITEALAGWSYGRSEDERAANQEIARKSLEWLRDEGGDEVKQQDVPLNELADDDPEERAADTLWRSVIRGAWNHAVGQGYVEKPHSRAYRWVGHGG